MPLSPATKTNNGNKLEARMPDPAIEPKVRRIARDQRRPFANMVYHILASYIEEYERTHGEIEIESDEEGEIDG